MTFKVKDMLWLSHLAMFQRYKVWVPPCGCPECLPSPKDSGGVDQSEGPMVLASLPPSDRVFCWVQPPLEGAVGVD